MNQEINFYTRAYRPRIDWLSLEFSMLYLLVLSLALTIASLSEVFSQRQVSGALSAARTLNADWKVKVEALEAIVTDRAKDPALEKRVNTLVAIQKDKLVLKNFLDEEIPGNSGGFSPFFIDLAQYHSKGLRLTEVSLIRGGEDVRLGGEVLSGESVTRYLQALSQSDNFKGKSFSNLTMDLVTMSADEGTESPALGASVLRFSVETQRGVQP